MSIADLGSRPLRMAFKARQPSAVAYRWGWSYVGVWCDHAPPWGKPPEIADLYATEEGVQNTLEYLVDVDVWEFAYGMSASHLHKQAKRWVNNGLDAWAQLNPRPRWKGYGETR